MPIKPVQLRSQLIEILNVPRGYASGFDSPAALLDGLFEYPARCSSGALDVWANGIPPCHNSFSAAC